VSLFDNDDNNGRAFRSEGATAEEALKKLNELKAEPPSRRYGQFS